MAKRRYTTAEAFRMVASGEREEMRAPRTGPYNEERIIVAPHVELRLASFQYRSHGGDWKVPETIPNRDDYYDPNESEEPATEPQWRPCSKAFALRNPEQSEARCRCEGETWAEYEQAGKTWNPVSTYHWDMDPEQYQFRTHAPIPSGYICEVPEGTRAVEVRITDARGRESSSGTIEVSGGAGFVMVVEGVSK